MLVENTEYNAVWEDDEQMKYLDFGFVIVEKQNRIINDHRHPFWTDWTLEQFLNNYKTETFKNGIYMITPIPKHIEKYTPSFKGLSCPELQEGTKKRLWMSNGNTSSSLHFDTHDAVLHQLSGTKDVFLYAPEDADFVYMNDATRYGLSPINVDTVDLRRFPKFSKAMPFYVHLKPGNSLYIPANFWHQLYSHPGRNVMIVEETELVMFGSAFQPKDATDAFLAATKNERKGRKELRCTSQDHYAHFHNDY